MINSQREKRNNRIDSIELDADFTIKTRVKSRFGGAVLTGYFETNHELMSLAELATDIQYIFYQNR